MPASSSSSYRSKHFSFFQWLSLDGVARSKRWPLSLRDTEQLCYSLTPFTLMFDGRRGMWLAHRLPFRPLKGRIDQNARRSALQIGSILASPQDSCDDDRRRDKQQHVLAACCVVVVVVIARTTTTTTTTTTAEQWVTLLLSGGTYVDAIYLVSCTRKPPRWNAEGADVGNVISLGWWW